MILVSYIKLIKKIKVDNEPINRCLPFGDVSSTNRRPRSKAKGL